MEQGSVEELIELIYCWDNIYFIQWITMKILLFRNIFFNVESFRSI
jgi:hypothetical protein